MNISPGQRQRHAHKIREAIRRTNEVIEALEKHTRDFDETGAVIPASWLDILTREVSIIEYLVGMANGAVILPDMTGESK